MSILITAIITIVASLALWLSSQYMPIHTVSLLLYVLTLSLTCICCVVLERYKRWKLVQRITALFANVNDTAAATREDELSALERQVMRQLKNARARETRVDESYRSIASLVSDISHQCKTPLSSMIMYTDLLPDTEHAAVIRSQSEKLSFLLDALTRLSKCEGGLISENLHPSHGSLQELICRAANGVISDAEKKEISILSDIPNGLSAVFDVPWTAEALGNILDNAIKYAPTHSDIRITVLQYEMFVRINIADDGPGIPDAELCNVWNRFFRGSNVPDTVSGVGIGLYLTQKIINAEGGRVSVTSEVGEGSTFSVFLPAL